MFVVRSLLNCCALFTTFRFFDLFKGVNINCLPAAQEPLAGHKIYMLTACAAYGFIFSSRIFLS